MTTDKCEHSFVCGYDEDMRIDADCRYCGKTREQLIRQDEARKFLVWLKSIPSFDARKSGIQYLTVAGFIEAKIKELEKKWVK